MLTRDEVKTMKSKPSRSKKTANSVEGYQLNKSIVSEVNDIVEVPVPYQSLQEQVVYLVNEEREGFGIDPLMIDLKLSEVVNLKAVDMRDNNYFSHYSIQYGTPFEMLRNFGVSYRYGAENIAAGYITPQEVFEGWKNSPGHYANMLGPNYKYTRVGYAQGLEFNEYQTYWVQLFTG